MTDSLLHALIGEETSSVTFVRDYVQLDFDGPQLSLFTWPRVSVGSTNGSMGEPGYRDMLCDLIGRPVLAVAEGTETGLVLDFGHGSVVIKLDPSEVADGPEIALLMGFTDRPGFAVWRPGEYPFDGPEWS
ncbi:hypothetical protein [Streptosporangium sp. CA-115845]|uniref:hypothetical protein n=1 Tax=Streptosporangium sp. CA-115845 TaxID=3240071 RepID=UPI003D94E448